MTDTKKSRRAAKSPARADRSARAERSARSARKRESGKPSRATESRASSMVTSPTAVASSAEKGEQLVLGAEARAHLLPPEILLERRAKVIRNRLGLGVIAVVVVVVLGTGAASLAAMTAQSNLAAEQSRTQSLLSQQLKYVKVRAVQDQVGLVKAAQQVGASTEIQWKKYLIAVQGTLPANVTISTVNVDSSTPLALYAQPTAALQGARVATLSFTATSPTLPEVPAWLNALTTLPGYADALPGSVTRDATSGVYTVNITMHVNEDAFDKRFAKAGK